MKRAGIIVQGLVQGVGFRYFIYRKAQEIGGLTGYVRNLFTGEVEIVAEGAQQNIDMLFEAAKIGPRSAQVHKAFIEWTEPTHEFTIFEVR